MVIPSVLSPVQESITAAARQTQVIVIVVQALGLPAAVRPQDDTEPRVDEEITKESEIFRRRGADVLRGYSTDRGLSADAELLPTGFYDALRRLGRLDIGAGAVRDGRTDGLCFRPYGRRRHYSSRPEN